MDDYNDIFREFEIKKRKIDESGGENVVIRLPLSLVKMFESSKGTTFVDFVARSSFSDRISVTGDKLKMRRVFMQSIFEPTMISIADHLNNLMQQGEIRGCSIIMMVGGFSECGLLQTRIKETFPDMKVIIPEGAGLVVLKGAVEYGHNPTAIVERVCKFTYGFEVRHTKNSNCQHPETITNVIDGINKCFNIFDVHVKAEQSVRLGEEQQEQIYETVVEGQSSMTIPLYASLKANPELTTEDGCRKVGQATIPLTDMTGGLGRKVGVSMMFGGTEIEVKVVVKSSGEVHYYHVDFLG